MKRCKHWTVLQAEEANRVPDDQRPFCWHCHRRMVWAGSWQCPQRAAETAEWLERIRIEAVREREKAS